MIYPTDDLGPAIRDLLALGLVPGSGPAFEAARKRALAAIGMEDPNNMPDALKFSIIIGTFAAIAERRQAEQSRLN